MSDDQRANDERLRRRMARLSASFIKEAFRCRGLALSGEVPRDSTEQRELLEKERGRLSAVGQMITRDDPVKFLRLVADELEGKLKDYRVGSHDEKIEEVWNKLSIRRNAAGAEIFREVSFPEFKKAFRARWTHPSEQRLSDFTLRRALKRLGHIRVPPKRGRPRRKK